MCAVFDKCAVGTLFVILVGNTCPIPSHGAQRRRAEGGIMFRPNGYPADFVGLCGMSVMDAAALDGEDISWRIDTASADGNGHEPQGLSRLIALMEWCLTTDPTKRPSLEQVRDALRVIPLSP